MEATSLPRSASPVLIQLMSDYTDVRDAFVEARIAGQDASDLEDAYKRSDFSRIIPALQMASSAHHRAADCAMSSSRGCPAATVACERAGRAITCNGDMGAGVPTCRDVSACATLTRSGTARRLCESERVDAHVNVLDEFRSVVPCHRAATASHGGKRIGADFFCTSGGVDHVVEIVRSCRG
jgi:hypothetical protein